MKNIKFVSFSAAAGFLLSLIFGIFSKSGILKVLLTAFVFAIIFAVLGFGISFIYEKFLVVDGSDFDSSRSSEPKIINSSSVGNNVDIVIEDQELERSESGNHYDVGENRSMLSTSDVVTSNNSESLNNSSTVEENSNFVPVRNLETLTNFSGTEAVKPTNNTKNQEDAPVSSNTKNEEDDLDVLPDFGSMGTSTVSSAGASSSNDSIDIFSDTGSSSGYTRRNDVDTDKFQNTELIAKAISSVLSDES